jgi:hypothetical protein
MDLTGAGGGLMLVLAAGLWLVYLVPNWLRRKEFAATERNAVRLQRTMRVLAETAEAPVVASPPRIQPTSRIEPASRIEPVEISRTSNTQVRSRRARPAVGIGVRLRRSRAIASLVLLAGLITFVVQLGVSLSAGWSAGGFLVAGVGAVLGVTSIALLRRLASVRPAQVAPRRATVLQDIELQSEPVVREWTPVQVPRPIERPRVAPSTMADPRIAAAAAAEAEERARRRTDREIAPLPSRFAAMGVVAEEAPALDLDAVLARRRA